MAYLSWGASTDNVGVAGYRVYRNGSQLGTTTATTYFDSPLKPGTTYTYTVRAYDAAGNVGPPSNAVTVTTPAAAPDTTPPTVHAFTSAGTRSAALRLRYSVSDDSAMTSEVIRIYRGRRLLRLIVTPFRAVYSNTHRTVFARAPERAGRLRFCVRSRDRAGNEAGPSCARLVVR